MGATYLLRPGTFARSMVIKPPTPPGGAGFAAGEEAISGCNGPPRAPDVRVGRFDASPKPPPIVTPGSQHRRAALISQRLGGKAGSHRRRMGHQRGQRENGPPIGRNGVDHRPRGNQIKRLGEIATAAVQCGV